MHEQHERTTRESWSSSEVPPFPVTARRRAPGEPLVLRRTPLVGTLQERLARLHDAMNPPRERSAHPSSADSGTV